MQPGNTLKRGIQRAVRSRHETIENLNYTTKAMCVEHFAFAFYQLLPEPCAARRAWIKMRPAQAQKPTIQSKRHIKRAISGRHAT
jgi:hypothetical protein